MKSRKPDIKSKILREWRGFEEPPLPDHARSIQAVIPGLMKSLGLQQKVLESGIINHWKEIVGEFNAQNSQPLGLSRKILTVGLSHPAFHHAIRSQKKMWIDKINKRFGQELVRDIIFRVGGG